MNRQLHSAADSACALYPQVVSTLWTVSDVVALMDAWYPPSRAEDWDRVGLILGNPQQQVKKIVLALDPVAATVDEAIAEGADMLLVHHPLYLRGTSFLPESDPKGALVARLIRADVALFAAHTNADSSPGGTADALAALLGVRNTKPLVEGGLCADGTPYGLGAIGDVTPMTLGNFADLAQQRLPAGPYGLYVGGDESATISRVALCPGAGDSFLADARAAGADVYLTADLRHHPASEHLEGGAPALICASHWATEAVWMPPLARRLRAAAADANVEIDVKVSTIATEPWTSHRRTLGGL